jgi:hypothetical protein
VNTFDHSELHSRGYLSFVRLRCHRLRMYQKDVGLGSEVSIPLNRRLIDSNVTKLCFTHGSYCKTNHIAIALSVIKTTRIVLFTESKARALSLCPRVRQRKVRLQSPHTLANMESSGARPFLFYSKQSLPSTACANVLSSPPLWPRPVIRLA